MPNCVTLCGEIHYKMANIQQIYEALRNAVVMVWGKKPHVIHDFHDLSDAIASSVNRHVSDTTLRRFWGYQEADKNISPSRYTLDTLSIYAGFKSWDDFCEYQNYFTENNSEMIFNEYLHSTDLEIGYVVRLTWKPDRQMWVRYLGDNMWSVEKSVNGKLSEGYTFFCATLIKHLPLVLTKVSKDGSNPIVYRCGTEGGIDYQLEQ